MTPIFASDVRILQSVRSRNAKMRVAKRHRIAKILARHRQGVIIMQNTGIGIGKSLLTVLSVFGYY